MRKLGAFTLALTALAAIAWTQAESAAQEALKNWPQWRGPLANGVAPQGNPPVTWSEEQNIQWKVKCPGGGSASPVVWGDKVFILAAEATDKPGKPAKPEAAATEPGKPEAGKEAKPKGPGPGSKMGGKGKMGFGGMGMAAGPSVFYKFEVLCFDRKDGKLLWQQTAREEVPHEGFRQGDGGYACYSPVTDGEYVYAYFGSRGLHCYDLNGNRKWERELGKMNMPMQFGEGGSPVLCGDKIIVKRDHEGGASIIALNKRTGETAWEMKRDERTSWSTPLVVEHQGKPQVVTTASNRVRSYDPDSGKVLWECGGLTSNVIPSPVSGFDMVFATSGFRGFALMAIQLGRSGDLTDSDAVKWKVAKATPYVPSPLLYGDLIYVFSVNNGIVSCYQAETGTPAFTEKRLEGVPAVYASPVGAADRVYLVGRNGKTVVIKRSKDFEVLATNTLKEGFDASPAIVGDQLLLRGKEYLYSIRESK